MSREWPQLNVRLPAEWLLRWQALCALAQEVWGEEAPAPPLSQAQVLIRAIEALEREARAARKKSGKRG